MDRPSGPLPFPELPAVPRHALALVAVVLVFLLPRSNLLIDDGSRFLLLSIAILGCAWFAGTGNALGATVLGAILGSIFDDDHSPGVAMHLALFVGQGILLTALVAELR